MTVEHLVPVLPQPTQLYRRLHRVDAPPVANAFPEAFDGIGVSRQSGIIGVALNERHLDAKRVGAVLDHASPLH